MRPRPSQSHRPKTWPWREMSWKDSKETQDQTMGQTVRDAASGCDEKEIKETECESIQKEIWNLHDAKQVPPAPATQIQEDVPKRQRTSF